MYNPQICYADQYYAHGFSKNLSYDKDISIVDLFGWNPI